MNKEMIKALIADGWVTVSCNDYGEVYVTKDKRGITDFKVPKCLFPNINSPVELKTLLVDEEESEEQEFIRSMLSIDKEAYLLKEFDSYVFEDNEDDVALWCKEKSGLHFYDAQKLKSYFPKEIHEKVYLKDIVKKRKVKKSVWVAVDKDGNKKIHSQKPNRGNVCWLNNSLDEYSYLDDIDFLNGVTLTWKDEPIELTYEV